MNGLEPKLFKVAQCILVDVARVNRCTFGLHGKCRCPPDALTGCGHHAGLVFQFAHGVPSSDWQAGGPNGLETLVSENELSMAERFGLGPLTACDRLDQVVNL